MRTVRFLPILFPALFSAACLHASRGLKAPEAFARGGVTTGSGATNLEGQGVRRVRRVMMNLELFGETQARQFMGQKRDKADGNQPVEMNFFPNVRITVGWNQVERVDRPSGFVWSGTVVGAPAGHAVMAISGKNVTATVTRGDGWIYEIRTAPDGGLWVREIDQKKFPKEREPVAPGRE